MQDYRKYIKQTFDRYKRKSKTDPLICLAVYDSQGLLYAYLKPIIAEYKVASPHYVKMLSQWRRDNPIISLGTFEVTEARTERWLDDHVISRDDRILFIVESLQGLEIGQVGYSSFVYEERRCEIDKVLRAVKGVLPGVMRAAMVTLIRWGSTELKLESICLRVLSDNEHAIRFYDNLGFSSVRTIPLYERRLADEVRWEELPAFDGQPSGKAFLEMQLRPDVSTGHR